MIRSELFNYHMLYDISDVSDDLKHYYVYSLPYYDDMYMGHNIYPEGVKLYIISSENYIRLLTMKQKNKQKCQSYVEQNIDNYLIQGKPVEGFTYIGDKSECIGSLPSAIVQLVLRHTHDISVVD